MIKNPPANAGDAGLIPGEGNGNPLQHSWRENSVDRGAWQTSVHGGRKRAGRHLATKQQQQRTIVQASASSCLWAKSTSQPAFVNKFLRMQHCTAVQSHHCRAPFMLQQSWVVPETLWFTKSKILTLAFYRKPLLCWLWLTGSHWDFFEKGDDILRVMC